MSLEEKIKHLIERMGESQPQSERTPEGSPTPQQLRPSTSDASEGLIETTLRSRASQIPPFMITATDRSIWDELVTGFKLGLYGELDFLDKAADWIEKHTGLEKGGLFQTLKEKVKPEDYELSNTGLLATTLRAVGMLPVQIGGALFAGGVGGGILKLARLPQAVKLGKLTLGTKMPVGFGVMGAAHAGVEPDATAGDVAKGAAIGTGMGVALGALHPTKALVRVPGTATVFGGLTKLEGGTPEEVIAQALVGGILGIPGQKRPGGKLPPGATPQETTPTATPPTPQAPALRQQELDLRWKRPITEEGLGTPTPEKQGVLPLFTKERSPSVAPEPPPIAEVPPPAPPPPLRQAELELQYRRPLTPEEIGIPPLEGQGILPLSVRERLPLTPEKEPLPTPEVSKEIIPPQPSPPPVESPGLAAIREIILAGKKPSKKTKVSTPVPQEPAPAPPPAVQEAITPVSPADLPKSPPKVEATAPQEAFYIVRDDVKAHLAATRDFRPEILDKLPDKWLAALQKAKSLKGSSVVFNPETQTWSRGSIPPLTASRLASMSDAQIKTLMNKTMSASAYNKLAMELESRRKRLLKQVELEEGLSNKVSVKEPGTKEDPFRQALVQGAYAEITEGFPGKRVSVANFLDIAQDKYKLTPAERAELKKFLNLEGWVILGTEESLESLVKKKITKEIQPDETVTKTIEKEAKAEPAAWEVVSEEYLKKAVKDKIISSKEDFNKLPAEIKGEVVEYIDMIYDLKDEAASLKQQNKLDAKTQQSYSKKIAAAQAKINRIFKWDKLEEMLGDQPLPDKITGTPFEKLMSKRDIKLFEEKAPIKETKVVSKEAASPRDQKAEAHKFYLEKAVEKWGAQAKDHLALLPTDKLMAIAEGTITPETHSVTATGRLVKIQPTPKPSATAEKAAEAGKALTKEQAQQLLREYQEEAAKLSEYKTLPTDKAAKEALVERIITNQLRKDMLTAYVKASGLKADTLMDLQTALFPPEATPKPKVAVQPTPEVIPEPTPPPPVTPKTTKPTTPVKEPVTPAIQEPTEPSPIVEKGKTPELPVPQYIPTKAAPAWVQDALSEFKKTHPHVAKPLKVRLEVTDKVSFSPLGDAEVRIVYIFKDGVLKTISATDTDLLSPGAPLKERVAGGRGTPPPANKVWEEFKKLANEAGYTEKVVGDYAFRRKGQPGLMRLTASTKDSFTVYEEGKGSYKVPLTTGEVQAPVADFDRPLGTQGAPEGVLEILLTGTSRLARLYLPQNVIKTEYPYLIESKTPVSKPATPAQKEKIVSEKAISETTESKAPEAPELSEIKQEIAIIRERAKGREKVEEFLAAYEKYRRGGLDQPEAATKAANEVGWKLQAPKEAIKVEEVSTQKTKRTKSPGALEKELTEEAERLYERAKKRAMERGLSEIEAAEEADAVLTSNEIKAYFANRRKGMNPMEASAKAKDLNTTRVIVRKASGEEHVVSTREAQEVAKIANAQIDKVVETAKTLGLDPEVVTQVVGPIPKPATEVTPRPSGMEHLPNPSEVFITATLAPSKLAEGLPTIKAKIKEITEVLHNLPRGEGLRKALLETVDVQKKLELERTLIKQANLRNQLVKDLTEYTTAAKYLEERMKSVPSEFAIEARVQDVDSGAAIVSQQIPGGSRFYILQDERGHAPKLEAPVKYGGVAELTETPKEVVIKNLQLEKNLPDKLANLLYESIKEKYMMGKKGKRVVLPDDVAPKLKRASEDVAVLERMEDVGITHEKKEMLGRTAAYQEDSLLKRFWYSIRGYAGEREEYRQIMRAVRSIRGDIDPWLVERLKRPEGEGKLIRNEDYVPLVDLLGDPTRSTHPVIAWVGNMASQVDKAIAKYITSAESYLDQNLGWLKRDAQASREFVWHMHGIRKSTNPRILEAEKIWRRLDNDIAQMFDLEARGLYRKDHFGLIIDREQAWSYFKQPIQLAKDFSELPKKVQVHLKEDNWIRAKYLADKYSTWEQLPKAERAWIEEHIFPWGGIFTDWMRAPGWLQQIIPREHYVKYFEPRKSNLEFMAKQDAWDTMITYLNVAVRGGMWNDFQQKVVPVIQQLPGPTKAGTVRHYLEKYVRNLAYPEVGFLDSKWNALVGEVTRILGSNAEWPFFIPRKIAGLYGRALYRGSLGPDTAIRNLTQSLHTWANSGTLPFLTGVRNYLHGVGMAAAKKLGKEVEIPSEFKSFKENYSVIDEFLGLRLDKFYKSSPSLADKAKRAEHLVTQVVLSPMHFTENVNKGIAYLAALQEGIQKGYDFQTAHIVGLSKASTFQNFNLRMTEAQWHAVNKMVEAQYGYTTAHTSPYLTGTGMKFFTPFWSFPIKSLQFISNGIKESFVSEDNARLVRFLALAGFMATAPAIIAEVAGIDASAIWGKGILPFRFQPSWMKLMRDIYVGLGGSDASYLDEEKARQATKDVIGLLTVPNWRWGVKVKKNLEDLQRGYEVWGPGSHPFNSVSTADVILKLTGFPPESSREARELLKDIRDEELRVFKKHDYIREIAELYENGGEKALQAIAKKIDKARQEGLKVTYRDIVGYRRLKQVDIYTQKMTKSKKEFRTGEWRERLAEAREQHYLKSKYGTRPMWAKPKTSIPEPEPTEELAE